MKINEPWHQKHPMPKNPTKEQRIKWHVAHAKNCGCRAIPSSIAAEIKSRRGGL